MPEETEKSTAEQMRILSEKAQKDCLNEVQAVLEKHGMVMRVVQQIQVVPK